MRGRARRPRLSFALGALTGAAATTVLLLAAAFFGIGWWDDYAQEPRRADMIVALAGGYARAAYAADLYRQGFAPEVWISRPAEDSQDRVLKSVGLPVRREEEIDAEILRRKGVPAAAIRPYGDGVLSTTNEALALRTAIETRGKRLLIVTSRFHARRARLIFRRVLKGADVSVVATPYEDLSRPWWRNRERIEAVVLEPVKAVFFLLGGRFVARPAR